MIKWLEDAVFYEVYPQSFRDSNGDGIGDIPGITEKLEYIQELGCNALWINVLPHRFTMRDMMWKIIIAWLRGMEPMKI